ncbi:MAG TPA: bifunctional 4-hydroxy-2-oxoglutarate aldolase/2-dehydro-3-deoxy-phosphogluconate aldolase [Dongiaceae bacterium]|jgi:2-dehydro-3-deoxyphosphogluconate aldolase/(4S)-4-hydroxy-2-oxoglutarate aldolase|nr:bifunctional 4-hydroxy-2-oxoglutarate aldolase/2-dehydro-3-deoxy-phosphogluconate aldolase [Dongiaceae bacterium]
MTNPLHEWLEQTRIVPVIVIGDVAHAHPMAEALQRGGVRMLEITLRRAAGWGAIESLLARNLGDLRIGAGTVTKKEELLRLKDMGAHFAVSPGFLPELAGLAREIQLPYLPGVQTMSELMAARAMGFTIVKFFPAEAAGGISWLKAAHGPFGDMHFCPTGGITLDKVPSYLLQQNVLAVGVTALTPPELIATGQWEEITTRTKNALTGHL